MAKATSPAKAGSPKPSHPVRPEFREKLRDGIITDCARRLREKDAAKLDDFDDDFERLFAQLVEQRPTGVLAEGRRSPEGA